ncbi:methyltransferase domain-containing protein [Saccharopolyspora sp. CA-218241]|uniref:methyltransferase domain-containing protein n=1 Tax=Saccharopolyspora sp. CA-218241 TaxID=3240027 RepID=UPI003D99438B
MELEALRDEQRLEWGLSAPGWLEHRDHLSAPSGAMTWRILERAALRSGDAVLDLACGIGNPSAEIAEVVGSGGRVLGLDLSEQMIAGAKRWAAERAASQVEFRVIREEGALDLGGERFDAAVCRVGLQYMPDQRGALSAVRGCLVPGGAWSQPRSVRQPGAWRSR